MEKQIVRKGDWVVFYNGNKGEVVEIENYHLTLDNDGVKSTGHKMNVEYVNGIHNDNRHVELKH